MLQPTLGLAELTIDKAILMHDRSREVDTSYKYAA